MLIKVFSCLIISYLQIKSYNVLNYNNCSTDCRFRGVDQGMKQTYLYLWYPLFQAQWDGRDQQNRQT